MKEYDFVVIGSGIAGLSFALKAARHGSVAVVTKRKGADTNTAWAQGGIACVTSDEDSFELHVRDTLNAGAGLCDESVVRTIVTEAPARIHDLVELGLHFDEREVSGHREFDLGREGGHSKRRVLHVADVTGKEIENVLLRELGRQSHVDLLENHMAVDLITAANSASRLRIVASAFTFSTSKPAKSKRSGPIELFSPPAVAEKFISTRRTPTSRPVME